MEEMTRNAGALEGRGGDRRSGDYDVVTVVATARNSLSGRVVFCRPIIPTPKQGNSRPAQATAPLSSESRAFATLTCSWGFGTTTIGIDRVSTPPRSSTSSTPGNGGMEKMLDAEGVTDFKIHARFENKDEFVALRDQLLSVDVYSEPTEEQRNVEASRYKRISMIVCHSSPLFTVGPR